MNSNLKSNSNSLRCVSGLLKNNSINFTDNSDGTVKDNSTGLIWEKCFRGRNNDGTCTDNVGVPDTADLTVAISYCSGLTLSGKTWRLPQINELKTIVDKTLASGTTINNTIFPQTIASFYWSSTTLSANTSFAWGVSFNNGFVINSNKTDPFSIRCVADQ